MGDEWDSGPVDYGPPDPGPVSAPETTYNASTMPTDFSTMGDSPYKTAEEVQKELRDANANPNGGEQGWTTDTGEVIGAVPVYTGQEIPPFAGNGTSPGDGFFKGALNKWTDALKGLIRGSFNGAGSANHGNKSGVPTGPIWDPTVWLETTPSPTQQKAPTWVGLQMPVLMILVIAAILALALGSVVRK